MKNKNYKKLFQLLIPLILLIISFAFYSLNSKKSIKDDIVDYTKQALGAKTYQQHNTVNHSNDRFVKNTKYSEQKHTTYIPKGNKKEFCHINTFNGIFPNVDKGFNSNNNSNELIELCYSGYTALFKSKYNIALWTAEKLNPLREQKSRNGEREETFYQDPTLIEMFGEQNVVKTEDYIGASDGKMIRYDRGHLSPSRDMPLEDRYESFYMSNIVPQSANNNRNVWADIEKTSRCLAMKYNTDVYVVNVPVIDIKYYQKNNLPLPTLKTKRGLSINIPDYMAKGIYIPKTNDIAVYLTKNDLNKIYYQLISVNQLKNLSFIDIFPQLDENLKNKISILPKPGDCK